METNNHNYVLAYDLIVSNGQLPQDKDYKVLYKEVNTISSLNLDYSQELKEDELADTLFDKLLGIMQNHNFAIKVAKVLKTKGLITEANLDNCELSIMVWSDNDQNCYTDYNINGVTYYERAYCPHYFNDTELFEEELKRLKYS